jgi:penicillin-binding protein 1A
LAASSTSGTTLQDSPGCSPSNFGRWRKFFAALASFLLLVCIACATFACGVAVQGYLLLSPKLPSIEKIKNYEPCTVNQVYADDGQLIGEFCHERRYVVPIDEMPQALQEAVVAAEGKDFWKTPGLDARAIFWEAMALFKTKEINAQPSAVFRCEPRITPEKRVLRKIKKALLLYRIERDLVRKEILHIYLNQIYLGEGAYGVEAASRVYFGKSSKNLSIAECAMIAGLIRSPSRFSPKRDMSRALERRNYVLLRMREGGKITQAEYDKATHEEPIIAEKASNPCREKAAGSVEHVRQYIVKKYGEDTLYNGGLKVYTTISLARVEEAPNSANLHGAHVKKVIDRHGKVLEENL